MKNNEKGFTLVELLVVIAILLLIVGIAVPSIISLRNRSYNKVNKTQIKEFESLAKSLANNYDKSLSSTTNCYFLTLEDMVNKKILDEIPIDANGDRFSNTSGVRICGGSTITYEYDTEKSNTDKNFSELSPNTVVYDEYSIPSTGSGNSNSGTSNKFKVTNLVPKSITTQEEILALGNDGSFKQTFIATKNNKESANYYVKIDLTDLEVSYQYKSYDIKWALFEETPPIHTGSFVTTLDNSTSINLATNILIDSSKEFTLYIWANNNGDENQSDDLDGGSIKGKITISGTYEKLSTLESAILSDNTIITSGNGLYKSEGTTSTKYGFPAYYYNFPTTSDVNNFVYFGILKIDSGSPTIRMTTLKCSEPEIVLTGGSAIPWKIMGINEDGSIKLLSLAVISEEYGVGNNYDSSRKIKNDYLQNVSSNYETYSGLLKGWYYINLSDKSDKIQVRHYVINSKLINEKIGYRTGDFVSTIAKIGQIKYQHGSVELPSLPNYICGAECSLDDEECSSSYHNGVIHPVIDIKADTLVGYGNGTLNKPYILE